MTVPRILLLLTLVSGCASMNRDTRAASDAADSARSGGGTAIVASSTFTASEADGSTNTLRDIQTRSPARVSPRQEPRLVPLRHFYLLSPGPNATLVVTQRDLSTH